MALRELYVSKLSVSGFKSFADGLDVDLPSGIIAVVGPNGAGKSNIAEAVRWAFGEQKVARLRADHSSDVLFSGNSKRARAGLAQVQLQFSQQSAKVNFSISRKLYRGGESEYQLNGRSVKLSTLRQTLTKKGVATQSYSVINQGTVEQMVTGSDQQRTELFEEASGVRAIQMEKQATESQLRSALKQLDAINQRINELLPGKSQLEAYQQSNQRKHDLQNLLNQQRVSYITQQREHLFKQQTDINHQIELRQAEKIKLDKTRLELEKQEKSFDEHGGGQKDGSLQQLSKQLEDLREELQLVSLGLLQAEQSKQQLESQLTARRTTISQLNQTSSALKKLVQKTSAQQTKVAELQAVIEQQNSLVAELSQELAQIRKDLSRSQKKEYLHHALGLLRLLETNLNNPDQQHTVELALFKLKRMVQYAIDDNAAELALRISELQRDISKLMGKREDVLERHTHETIALRSSELDIVSLQQQQEQLHLKQVANDNDAKQLVILEQKITQLSVKKTKLEKHQTNLQTNIENSQSELAQANTPKLHTFVKDIQDVTVDITQNQAQLAQLTENLEWAKQEQVNLDNTSRDWFGKQIPKFEPTRKLVELTNIEKTLAQLEIVEQQQPDNLKELEDQAAELNFLQTQSHDLDKSIQDIQTILQKLDNSIGRQFKTAITNISKQFNHSFAKLFNGGTAQLSLETSDVGEVVRIQVTPPRKQTRQITALSGGEKTLTALALLKAIVATNPTPVLVLDEVDAALDDANSQAFSSLLRDLAKYSQVIIITHNHTTMQAANMLLGVTIARDGSSVIIPLTINQANQYADPVAAH